MKTRSERFALSRKDEWTKLTTLLDLLKRKGVRKLTARQAEDFPRLYRRACQDLSEARTKELSPDLIDYLNNLTGQAHYYLYFTKPITLESLAHFYRFSLPKSVIKNALPVLVAFLLFWGSALGTFIAVRDSPELAYRFVPQTTLEMMEDMYTESTAQGRTKSEMSMMAAYYIQHNTSIAFLCFATGVFLGLGSVFFLLYNGIFLGTIFAHLTNAGLGRHLLEFVTAHGFLELNGVVLSGAAGLLLGLSLIDAWKTYSKQALKAKQNEILTLVGAAAILLFFAALIEGMISPSPMNYEIKLTVALVSALLVLFYFFILPFINRRRF